MDFFFRPSPEVGKFFFPRRPYIRLCNFLSLYFRGKSLLVALFWFRKGMHTCRKRERIRFSYSHRKLPYILENNSNDISRFFRAQKQFFWQQIFFFTSIIKIQIKKGERFTESIQKISQTVTCFRKQSVNLRRL